MNYEGGDSIYHLDNYPEILYHLKSISTICKRESSGWYSIFCPYCDDSVRKLNPRHGHFHISSTYPYCHCFRCGKRISLYQFLIDTRFTNQQIIESLKKGSDFIYDRSSKIKSDKKYEITELKSKLISYYNWFSLTYPEQYKICIDYINKRCYEINPIKFFVMPSYENSQVGIRFLNYDGHIVTTRLINSNIRYVNPNVKRLYYFQNFNQIDSYNNIVICEGAIDLINLYNYYTNFRKLDSFYLSFGGNNYKKIITDLINTYLLIDKVTFHVVFDKGLKFMSRMQSSILYIVNELNPEINVQFYLPKLSKDVSECMLLDNITGG